MPIKWPWPKLLAALVGLVVALGGAATLNAQTVNDCFLYGICAADDPTNMQITCTGATSCTQANMGGFNLQVTSTPLPGFHVSIQGPDTGLNGQTGTAFLVVLVPNTAPAMTFTANGVGPSQVTSWTLSGGQSRFSVLGVSFYKTANAGIDPYLLATQAVDAAATGYTVYLFNVGSFSAGTIINLSFAGTSAFPAGTIFWAYLVDPNGLAINSTPFNQSLEVVPEPTSLILFGSGLLGAGVLLRKKKRTQSTS